ncbi:MAG: hypothetical protein DME50_03960 [Verrucomicrobia bacterium]|nr:MAG: hypothetical protein DME50_03960 [Verrucomicrobiota bacterium]
MSWLHHPRYARQRDALIELFQDKIYHFPTLRLVVFLCGGANSPVRERIAQYLRTKTKTLVFYADDVWARLAREDLNALQMEDQLAGLSDIVIIVVESPGTYCELGAFSLSAELRKKLLPIIDETHKDTASFINTGPVRWIDKESRYGPTLYGNHAVVLELIPEIERRMRPLRFRQVKHVTDIAAQPKYLLFLICDLVAIIGPVSLSQLEYYLTKIVGPITQLTIQNLLGLAMSLKLIFCRNDYYYCELNRGEMHYFRRKKFLRPPAERAKFMSVLQTIPEASRVLDQVTSR